MIVNVETPKESTKQILQIRRKISEVMGNVLIYKNQFLYTNEFKFEFYSQVPVYTIIHAHTEEVLGRIFLLKTNTDERNE